MGQDKNLAGSRVLSILNSVVCSGTGPVLPPLLSKQYGICPEPSSSFLGAVTSSDSLPGNLFIFLSEPCSQKVSSLFLVPRLSPLGRAGVLSQGEAYRCPHRPEVQGKLLCAVSGPLISKQLEAGLEFWLQAQVANQPQKPRGQRGEKRGWLS